MLGAARQALKLLISKSAIAFTRKYNIKHIIKYYFTETVLKCIKWTHISKWPFLPLLVLIILNVSTRKKYNVSPKFSF